MEQIKYKADIDPVVIGNIIKSCPKKIRPIDIIKVEKGYAVEIKNENGQRQEVYYFNSQGLEPEMEAQINDKFNKKPFRITKAGNA